MENISPPDLTLTDTIGSGDTSNVSSSVADDSSSDQELLSYGAPNQCTDVNNSCSESVSSYEKENSFFEVTNDEKKAADEFFFGSKNNSTDEETESNTSPPLPESSTSPPLPKSNISPPLPESTSEVPVPEVAESNAPLPLTESSSSVPLTTEVTESNTSLPSAEAADTSSQEPSQHSDSQPIIEETPDPRIAPKMNSPEKIIFCIDLSSEMIEPPFKLGNHNFSPLILVKRLIEIFVMTKTRMDSRHEFAIMAFHERAKWIRDFTNDTKEISRVLDELNDIKMCIDCPLSSIFSLLSAVAVDLPSFPQPDVVPPPFILRVILIYGRSYCLPNIDDSISIMKVLKHSPYFFLDILYIHEPPSENNRCQEIFETFCDFDNEYSSYMYDVGRNATKIHNCMAKLLAHPLLRPLQKNTHYSIKSR